MMMMMECKQSSMNSLEFNTKSISSKMSSSQKERVRFFYNANEIVWYTWWEWGPEKASKNCFTSQKRDEIFMKI